MKTLGVWFSIASCILVLAGLRFSLLRFNISHSFIIPREVLLPWESAIYGTILICWCTALFFLGQLAFHRNDTELMKILLIGITVWLIIEAIFSVYYGVFFNVGVDFAVLVIIGLPLLKSIRKINNNKKIGKYLTLRGFISYNPKNPQLPLHTSYKVIPHCIFRWRRYNRNIIPIHRMHKLYFTGMKMNSPILIRSGESVF